MARIRSIKPDLFKNDELAALDPLTRLAFIGLFGQADRRGRLEDRPKRLKAELLPYDDVDANAVLQSLHDAKFIIRYEANGVSLIQITNFEKHQRITGKEAATESEFPPPNDFKPRGINGETPGKRQRRKRETPGSAGREGKGKEGNSPLPPSLDSESGRKAFADWTEYRQQRGDRLTEQTVEKLLKHWEPLGAGEFVAAVNHSIAQGWKGVYPPKANDRSRGPPADDEAKAAAKRAHMQANVVEARKMLEKPQE